MAFPSDFVWGVATSSYQIEGYTEADGRAPSVWDVYSAESGKVFNGNTGKVACEHYKRYPEDVAIMKDLGIRAYRFSTAWPRIIPNGRGAVNQAGLDFYSRLVDTLLAAGIEPWITLYHWDMPWAQHQRGGWLNREIADDFAEYSKVVAEHLGDRVTNWMTFNEPQCFIGLSLEQGMHAPGAKLMPTDLHTAVHNQLIAHGKSVDALRAIGGNRFNIGYVNTMNPVIPFDETPEQVDAARDAFFSFYPQPGRRLWTLAAFTDPVFLSGYPADYVAKSEQYLPVGWEKDMAGISGKTDFCGINIYSGIRVKKTGSEITHLPTPEGHPETANKWNITPEALRWGPRFLYERYKKPVYITENGLSLSDWVHRDGKVHDPARIDFLNGYLLELEKAVADGSDIAGYFQWSLMDNFEWAEGYRERFGLIHVDYQTQKRTIKDSGYWYRKVIETNGRSLH